MTRLGVFEPVVFSLALCASCALAGSGDSNEISPDLPSNPIRETGPNPIIERPKGEPSNGDANAVPLPDCAPAAAGDTDSRAVELIDQDFAALPTEQKEQTIYISVAHLAEGRTECQMRELRYGIGKLLNMMSWAREVVPPTYIDAQDYIARVDARELQWPQDAIPYLLAISDNLAYGVLSDQPVAFRGDWLANYLTRPPVYSFIMRNEPTERLIEAQFGLGPDVEGKLSGVSKSIVTLHPRIIERRQADDASPYCWITHDFLHRTQAFASMQTGLLPQSDTRFGLQQYIAREYICELPNGMHVYQLTGFVSQRRWDGNTCVARNRNREDNLVLNGQCFACHGNGLNRFKDEVRANLDPGSFAVGYYPAQDELDAMLDRDQQAFVAAVSEIPYYEAGFYGPLNKLMGIYKQRSGDDMLASPAGAFGAILPMGLSVGPLWEDVVNPLATLAVDLGVLLPAEQLFEVLPEAIFPELQDLYLDTGIDPDMNCE